MAEYDLGRMQEEAVRRAKEMQSRARIPHPAGPRRPEPPPAEPPPEPQEPPAPPAVPAAALDALSPEGRELLLCYTDNGGDTVQAGWVAR